MKQLVLFAFALLSLPCLGQRAGSPTTATAGGGIRPPVELPYSCTEAVSHQQHTADSLLQALDKSQIPTHILYDRVAASRGPRRIQPRL